jgi:hypothetical protein
MRFLALDPPAMADVRCATPLPPLTDWPGGGGLPWLTTRYLNSSNPLASPLETKSSRTVERRSAAVHFTFSLILLVRIKSQAESSLSTFQPLRFPTIPLRSVPTQQHIVALTLYASLLKNDLGARDGCAVSFAYLLQVGVEETLDARFYAGSLLGEQMPSRCHARSCARARFLVVACEVGGLR